MTPEQLKASILQYAIQGKLVEQRPEDGTADEYLSEVCKLLSANRRIIDDEEKYIDIPQSWTWACISDLTTEEYVNDGNWVLSKDMVTQGDVKLIQLGSIGDNQYKEKGFKYLTYDHFQELNGRQIYPGYLLVNRLIGDKMLSCILPELDGILMTAVDVCWIAPHEECYDLRFLMYALSSSLFQGKVKELGRGTTRFRISKLNLINIAFPIPPLEEQHRIVAKIEELLPYVDRYAESYEKLEQFNAKFPEDMKKSILQYAIQGKLVEQRPEEGTAEELYQQIQENQPTLKDSKSDLVFDAMDFDIPETWKWVEVNQIFDFVDYRGKTPNKIAEGVFLVTASNIRQGYMDYTRKEHISREEFETRKSRGITEKGDLLFTTEAPMGNAAICDLEECSCGQRVITFKEYTEGTVCSELFMYFILSPAFQKQLVDNCTGTTAKGIKADKLKHLLIPLPPISEQHRIVEKINELLPFCNRLSERR